ncbi:hydrolase of sodium-potassium ATPase alpha subunit [Mycobacterium kansasii 732]|nr:hydrolase of sodium-potassium ATPase alpha subunit [Mycobacterium kansasii 732]
MAVDSVVTVTGGFDFDYQAKHGARQGFAVDPSADAELMRVLLVGVLCGNADYDVETKIGDGDPMEVALLQAGALGGLSRGDQLSLYPEVAEYPFDPATKWMATVHRDHDEYFAAMKGAPEVVLALADRIGVAAEPFDDDRKASGWTWPGNWRLTGYVCSGSPSMRAWIRSSSSAMGWCLSGWWHFVTRRGMTSPAR